MPEWTGGFNECNGLIVREKKNWENAGYRKTVSGIRHI